MIRKVLILSVMAVLFAAGCSSTPVTPDKQAMNEYFNSFDLSNPVVGEYTYTDLAGNVIASGTLGRNDGGLFVIESRGAQTDIDVTPLGLVNIFITYNNPAGTIPSGPNAGLPYYYLGQTVDYDINIVSFFWQSIGGFGGYGAGPAELTAEMHEAYIDANGQILPGPLMIGSPTFYWTGIVTTGYMMLNDTYTIVPGNTPGLNVTTARLSAPILFGLFDVVFFDGTAGIWDPQ